MFEGIDGSERVGGEGSLPCRGNSRGEDSKAAVCVPRLQRGYCGKERVKMRSENCERPGGEGRGDRSVCFIVLFRVR